MLSEPTIQKHGFVAFSEFLVGGPTSSLLLYLGRQQKSRRLLQTRRLLSAFKKNLFYKV